MLLIQDEYPVIYAIQKDSPADRAGARVEAKVLDIDGKSTKSLSVEAASALLRGTPGTSTTIIIHPPQGTNELTLNIQRETIDPSKPWIVSQTIRPRPQKLQQVILWGWLPLFLAGLLLAQNARLQPLGMFLQKTALAWIVLAAIFVMSLYVRQDFASRIGLILNIAFLAGWLPFGVLGAFVSEDLKRARLGNAILTVAAVWCMIAIAYAVFLYLRYVVQNPWLLSPTLFVLAIVLVTAIAHRFIFPSRRIAFRLSELARYRNHTIALLIAIPIAFSAAFYILRPSIDSEAIKLLYSSLFLGFCGLLVLTPTLSVLIIERSVHPRIANLLILTTKGLGLLYGLMIMISLMGLLSFPTQPISFGPGNQSWGATIASSLLLSAVSLGINSIVLTLIVSFQLIDVIKEETPPPRDRPRVLFEETRLYSAGFASECCVTSHRTIGYSDFREELEEQRFGVSRLTVSPISGETLKKYDVLVIARIASEYSNNEMEAITSFVSSGGGLLLMPGYFDASLKKELAGRLGFTLEVERVLCDATHCHAGEKNVPVIEVQDEHDEILGGVRRFFIWKGTFLKDIGTATALCFSSDKSWAEHPKEAPIVGKFTVLAKGYHGQGKVVCLSSFFQFSNECMQHPDNMVLAINIVKWLAKKEAKSGTAALPESPSQGKTNGVT